MFRFLAIVFVGLACAAPPLKVTNLRKPKLVVVVSIDQMRGDYLERFAGLFGNEGFIRLMTEGAWFPEGAHTHSATMTGPGHAAIATGCFPARAGIPGNSWYDATSYRSVYCVEDSSASVIGSGGTTMSGAVSPANLQVATLGDLLQEQTGESSLVYSLAIKDRAALLLGGHQSDGSFFLDKNTGTWVTSSALLDALPPWVESLNETDPILRYAGRTWDRTVSQSIANRLAGPDAGQGERSDLLRNNTFPHPMPETLQAVSVNSALTAGHVSLLTLSPFGDQATLDAARVALENTDLGKDAICDLLLLGFSSLDYVGHSYGPDSHEVMEMVVHLDRVMADLMGLLDAHVGAGEWVLALSSDHGVAPIPEQSGGFRRSISDLVNRLDQALRTSLGDPPESDSWPSQWVLAVDPPNVYLNREALEATRHPLEETYQLLVSILKNETGIFDAASRTDLLEAQSAPLLSLAQDIHPTRSGDVLFLTEENVLFTKTPASHGTHHPYDQKVPMIFFGKGIAPGRHAGPAAPIDLVPTLCHLLNLLPANPLDGKLLSSALLPFRDNP